MDDEDDAPRVFHPVSITRGVQLNIYAIEPGDDGLVGAYEALLLQHLNLPVGFWDTSHLDAQGWHKQSILTLQLPHQHLKMTRNDLTVKDVPLSDGSTGKGESRLFVLSPLLEVDSMHRFLPESQVYKKSRKKTSPQPATKDDDEEEDIDDWLDEEMMEEKSPQQASSSSSKKDSKRGRRSEKINQAGSITVRSGINGRFPMLSPAIEQFNAFVLAVDGVAKRVLQQDRRMLPNLEMVATYHTHIAKSDAYSSKKYRQSLEELQADHGGGEPLSECNINIKVKGNYIVRTSTSPEGGIYRAPRLDSIEHLPEVFKVEDYVPSSLEELVECGRGCYVQFLFHLGQLYERQATGRDASGVYRGVTLRVYRIVFWPIPERRMEMSVATGNQWGVSMHNSLAPTTAFYAVNSTPYVALDEYGNPVE